ncbi:glycosyltransferase [Silvibacterium acidisoli]|uniref:glycosyltransferase n=1 Tax=Acidobacteriaceae bacterium ZG23-2 TaxID=2883246 RepID=UPI00406CD626
MKVAFLVPMMSGRGGTESALKGLGTGLQQLGHDVRFYLFGGASTDPTWMQGLPYTILGERNDSRLARFRKYSFGLASEFRSYKPDAVIALDTFRLMKGRFALRLAGINAPLVSWIHFPVDRIKHFRILKMADGHLAISEGVAEQLRALLGSKSRGEVLTIYNAIDVNLPSVPRPEDHIEFLHIGRLEYEGQKRVADLLQAAARLRGSYHLTIIGDGNDRARLEELSTSLGIANRIAWLGWKDKPWDSVTMASTLILTSSFEGLGMILIEALARGIPCISSDCKVGPSEIVTPGNNGWLYPVADVDKLSAYMQEILDTPGVLPSQNTAALSAQKFSYEAVANRTLDALHRFGAKG